MKVGNKIKFLRKKNKMTQKELAEKLNIGFTAISAWERNVNRPLMDKLSIIANIFDVSIDYFFDSDEFIQSKSTAIVASPMKIPLYNNIAGDVSLEQIKIDEMIEVPKRIYDNYPNAFFLLVKGDLMNKLIQNGSYVLIDPCTELNNGEIGAFIINKFHFTLRKFYKLNDSIVLESMSYNSAHRSQIFLYSEQKSIKIIGKLVWYMPPVGIKF